MPCSWREALARPWSLLTDCIYGVKLPTRTEQLAAKLEKRISSTFIACQKGHAEVARKLLDAGADPHMARDDGATVLNTGSMCGFEEFAAGKNHT